jgi:hypothetical protein
MGGRLPHSRQAGRRAGKLKRKTHPPGHAGATQGTPTWDANCLQGLHKVGEVVPDGIQAAQGVLCRHAGDCDCVGHAVGI